MASARAKVSRLQSWARVIGVRTRPKMERMPNPIIPMRHPAAMTAAGDFHQGEGGLERVTEASGPGGQGGRVIQC